MKGLNQFLSFNWDAFSKGKTFLVIGVSDYQDFDTKKHLGTKVDCVIATDNTQYNFKDGEVFSNRYEKISFKVSKDVDVPVDTKIVPQNAVASIYGEYRNMLSVKCDDVMVVTPKEK